MIITRSSTPLRRSTARSPRIERVQPGRYWSVSAPVTRMCTRLSHPSPLPTTAIPIGRPNSTNRYGHMLGFGESAIFEAA